MGYLNCPKNIFLIFYVLVRLNRRANHLMQTI